MNRKMVSMLMAAAMGVTMAAGVMPVSAEEELSGKLVIWTNADSTVKTFDSIIDAYKEARPNVEVELVNEGTDNMEINITACAASGDYSAAPDIAEFQDYSFVKFVENYPDLFASLDDYDIPWDHFVTSKSDASTVDGSHYGVPFDNGVACAGWRTDVLADAGYTIEDLTDITWTRFIEIGKDVKAKTGYPMFASVAGEAQIICMMLTSAGVTFFDEEGMPNLADNSVLEEALRVYTELVSEGVVVEVTDWTQFNAVTANEVAIGFINGCWQLPSIEQMETQSGQWALTNIPRLEVEGGTNYTSNGGSSFAVLQKANVDLAVDFLTFAMTNPDTAEVFYSAGLENGKVGSYLPAADIEKYQEEVAFYGGQKIYDLLAGDFSDQIPSVKLGAYYYDGVRAVSTAASNVLQNGTSIADELAAAQETLAFNMGY